MIGIIWATYPYPSTSSSSSDPVFYTKDSTRRRLFLQLKTLYLGNLIYKAFKPDGRYVSYNISALFLFSFLMIDPSIIAQTYLHRRKHTRITYICIHLIWPLLHPTIVAPSSSSFSSTSYTIICPPSLYTPHILKLLVVIFPFLEFIISLPSFPIYGVCLIGGLLPFFLTHPWTRTVGVFLSPHSPFPPALSSQTTISKENPDKTWRSIGESLSDHLMSIT